MAINLNSAYQQSGTKFRVYPQAPVLASITNPEVIWVSPSSGSIAAGPSDHQMYVTDAISKRAPYEAVDLPPYQGPVCEPALPDRYGHFDHIQAGTRQFNAAHMYAVIRRVLDVWEYYFARTINWHFDTVLDRLELIPLVEWDNAQSGFGFIESGYRRDDQGELHYYCLNFDVLAHEIGHSIIYSEVGWPDQGSETSQYFGFQEAAADMTALIAVLHFDSVVDRLLQDTRGNLYALNELNRIAELSEVEQIRVASNDRRMSHYAAGWTKEHQLSQPLTGALFDILVEIYHINLLDQNLIDDALSDAAYRSILPEIDDKQLQRQFNRVFEGRHHEFEQALLQARDYVGILLADTWTQLSPHHLSYVDVGQALLRADHRMSRGRFRKLIVECFRWREIGAVEPGPRLEEGSVRGTKSCR